MTQQTGVGVRWIGGEEAVWRRLFARCATQLAAMSGTSRLLFFGEWLDDETLLRNLRVASWTVDVPARRRGPLRVLKSAPLVAWTISESSSDIDPLLSAAWSTDWRPQELWSCPLTGPSAPNSYLKAREVPARESHLFLADTDSVEVTIGGRLLRNSEESSRSILSFLEARGREFGVNMEIYRGQE